MAPSLNTQHAVHRANRHESASKLFSLLETHSLTREYTRTHIKILLSALLVRYIFSKTLKVFSFLSSNAVFPERSNIAASMTY
jgi:hypothetical protein